MIISYQDIVHHIQIASLILSAGINHWVIVPEPCDTLHNEIPTSDINSIALPSGKKVLCNNNHALGIP